jgi:hypothetical protein
VILVDTSVWIDHLRSGNPQLTAILAKDSVLVHPFVIGELALGPLRQPELILTSLAELPAAMKAKDSEVLELIRRWKIAGLGIGYIAAHLLTSACVQRAHLSGRAISALGKVAIRLSLAAPIS